MLYQREKKLKNLICATVLLCIIAVFFALIFFPARIGTDFTLSYYVILVALLFNITIYLIPAQKYRDIKLFYIITLVSIILISLLIHTTGGMQSQFFALYLVPIIFSSIFQQMRGALYSIIWTGILYFIIFKLETGVYNVGQNWDILSYHLRFFFLTAFFIGYLISKEKKYQRYLRNFILELLRTSTITVDIKEFHPQGHAQEVMFYSLKIAEQLKLSSQDKKDLQLACLFHDIGVSKISDNILGKQSKLTDEEWEEIKKHPEESVKFLSNLKELENVITAIRHIHERYDGGGYPSGLKGEDIPLLSRIIAVADAYSAMTHYRPYRQELSKDEAREEIEKNSGSQFDPKITEIFLKIMDNES